MTKDILNLTTEIRNENTINIDKISTIEMVKKINDEDKKIADAIELVLPKIAEAIDNIVSAMKNGGRLIYLGAGTSGRLGVLDASECPPTFGTSRELVQGIIAGGLNSLIETSKGAEDSTTLSIEDLSKINLSSKDILCGIAASGRTPYVLSGVNYAKSIGCKTIGVTTNNNSKLEEVVDIIINPLVGPEVICGSTRMKSGTAQKMILNMLTTGAMIKLGKVYENLMVDFYPSNEKLIERCKTIVMQATGVNSTVAEEYLTISSNNVKVAILMIKTGADKIIAEKTLSIFSGVLSDAINYINT